jgi:hypothetical protein
MKVKLFLIAVLLVGGFSVSAHAQSAFAGRYDLLSGYTTGAYFGLFGYGTATASRAGAVSYTAYYPRLRGSGSGSGRIGPTGVFSLNNRTTGSAQMYGNRVAVGTFRDAYGSGFFGLRKK